jgi:hypothetical protein
LSAGWDLGGGLRAAALPNSAAQQRYPTALSDSPIGTSGRAHPAAESRLGNTLLVAPHYRLLNQLKGALAHRRRLRLGAKLVSKKPAAM